MQDLSAHQTIGRSGARQEVSPGLRQRVITGLAALVAPLLTVAAIRQVRLPLSPGDAFLLFLSLVAWLALAHGAMRCFARRIAWQSGFLILHRPLGEPRIVPMAAIAQVRLARHGYRLFLCDNTNLHIPLSDVGARELLAAIMADVMARESPGGPAKTDSTVRDAALTGPKWDKTPDQ